MPLDLEQRERPRRTGVERERAMPLGAPSLSFHVSGICGQPELSPCPPLRWSGAVRRHLTPVESALSRVSPRPLLAGNDRGPSV